jgi:hypothetical protein
MASPGTYVLQWRSAGTTAFGLYLRYVAETWREQPSPVEVTHIPILNRRRACDSRTPSPCAAPLAETAALAFAAGTLSEALV